MNKSEMLYKKALEFIPGGVNSPVRAFRSVGAGAPLFAARGEGAYLYDEDGNKYIDYIGSWGPLIFGHKPEGQREVLEKAIESGVTFGAATAAEVEFAELICSMVPSLEMVRLVNSGTEATMSAIRLARGFTGRDYIVKCEGCYHGHGDSFLVKAGSGVATFGVSDSGGVPQDLARLTLTVPFNDLDAAEKMFAEHGDKIAAMIVEPVCGNMGAVPPLDGYLRGLRILTEKYGALLVFDEVMTGFRLSRGGAQELFGVTPDMTTLGKIIGGGLPVGAFGGRRDIMKKLAPEGPVYQAGTLSGNPLAVAAGIHALKKIGAAPPYALLEKQSARLENGIRANIEALSAPVTLNRVGSMMTLFFGKNEVRDFAGAKACDTAGFGRYFHAMLERGIFLPPSQFEACFISAAHSDADIDKTVAANREALKLCQS